MWRSLPNCAARRKTRRRPGRLRDLAGPGPAARPGGLGAAAPARNRPGHRRRRRAISLVLGPAPARLLLPRAARSHLHALPRGPTAKMLRVASHALLARIGLVGRVWLLGVPVVDVPAVGAPRPTPDRGRLKLEANGHRPTRGRPGAGGPGASAVIVIYRRAVSTARGERRATLATVGALDRARLARRTRTSRPPVPASTPQPAGWKPPPPVLLLFSPPARGRPRRERAASYSRKACGNRSPWRVALPSASARLLRRSRWRRASRVVTSRARLPCLARDEGVCGSARAQFMEVPPADAETPQRRAPRASTTPTLLVTPSTGRRFWPSRNACDTQPILLLPLSFRSVRFFRSFCRARARAI